ncbi:hypothetical protein Pmani_032176 [Petrolisthes manimaculis]|uniref:Condensation domain-containing protein n=1 Tax=Petrolisthes manimaculis TaxID=1843537 RepID=A0AAE1TR97_9EUCA|nr:hypothetical protein Pmani_032176 [Petrolisthes manimaculis]
MKNGACEKEDNRRQDGRRDRKFEMESTTQEGMKNGEREKEGTKNGEREKEGTKNGEREKEGKKNGEREKESGRQMGMKNRERENEHTENQERDGEKEKEHMKKGKTTKHQEMDIESGGGRNEGRRGGGEGGGRGRRRGGGGGEGGDGGEWVRLASRMEVAFELLGQHEFMLVCCKLSLSSDLSLTHQHLTKALTHLFRKTGNLRVRFGDKDGARWLREMADENIDFQIEYERSVEEVTQSLHTHQYNTTDGPLWCARLIPITDPHHQPLRFSSFCSHLTSAFPHCYHLLFGFHHSLGDGNTFNKICGAFVAILDDVVAECPIDDEKQIGKFKVNTDFDELMASQEEEIENNPALIKEYTDASKKGQPEKSLVNKILPTKSLTTHRQTLLETQTFDCETTSEFIRRSKMEGITVNSSFSAVCNIALCDLLREKEIQHENYVISNTHLIDMRRFWDPEVAVDNLGCYISLSNRVFVEVPTDVYQERLGDWQRLEVEQGRFWQVARAVHCGLHQLLESKDVLRRLAFVTVCMKTSEPHIDRDLSFNAHGDLSHLFSGRKHLQTTQLVNSTAIHRTPLPWEHVTCTVRGRLIHTVKYNSGLVTKDLVTRYMDHIFRRIHQVTAASKIT